MRKLSADKWSAGVPPGMKLLPRWCGFRGSKQPLDPRTGEAARVDDPSTFGTWDDALAWYKKHEREPDAGAGFVFTKGDNLVFVDVDHALDNGKPKPWAAPLVEQLAAQTYVEVSPSGTGLHAFYVGELERAPGVTGARLAVEDGAVEVYAERRFSTVTGRRWNDAPLGPVTRGLPPELAARLTRAEHVEAQKPEPLARRYEVWDALQAIDPDVSNDEWVRIGMALKAAFGDEGLPLWRKWSSRGAKYHAGEPEQRWGSFHRAGVGLGTIFRMAREAGWHAQAHDAVADAFTDLQADDAGIKVIPASQQPREHYDWLWKWRLARGHLTLMAGKPKQGKSIVTLDLAARVSRGLPMPGEAKGGPPGRVLLLNVEDGQGDTIRPRLEAAGADLDLVEILDLRNGGRIPQLPDDVEALGRIIERSEHAQLVVLDPLNAFLSGELDAHRDQDVRAALGPLFGLAQRLHVAFILVAHFNKAKDMDAVERIGGSIGIAAQARLLLGVGRPTDADEDDPQRVMLPLGGNLGPGSRKLAFEVIPWEMDPDVGRVRWSEDEPDVSVDDLVARPEAGGGARIGEAEAWLKARLSKESVASKELEEAARGAGISRATLNRAARRLGIRREKDGLAGGWRWPKWSPFDDGADSGTPS